MRKSNITCSICGGIVKEKKTNMVVEGQKVKLLYCKWCKHYSIDHKGLTQISTKCNYLELLKSVDKVRNYNYSLVVEQILRLPCYDLHINGLEVGSATGSFLELLGKYDIMNFVGIEPMKESYTIAKDKRLNVFNGYFPQDIPKDITDLDVVVFNDTFEHIPDSEEVLRECDKITKKDESYIFINLPVNSGFFFKTGRILDMLGFPDAFIRLWQLHTDSPHIHYYSNRSIEKLLKKYDFRLASRPINMMVLDRDNIENRVKAVPMKKKSEKMIIRGVKLLFPFIRIMPNDTKCFCFKRV